MVGVAQLDGSACRSQRIILVDDRHAEDGHDRVADELLDGAAMPLDRLACRREPGAHVAPDCLRIERLGKLGGADDVGEEDRHDPA